MAGYLVAWYLVLLIEGREYPMLVGPYDDVQECMNVEEAYQLRGYQTDGCTWMGVIPAGERERAPY